MSRIHLLAVCYAMPMDLKKYGFAPILRPFVAEIKKLESDSGTVIQIDAEDVHLRGALTSVSGDTLAAHEMFGFLSPSADRFCRLCLARRDEIDQLFTEEEFQLRTVEDHDRQVEAALQMRNGDPDTGVRNACILNETLKE